MVITAAVLTTVDGVVGIPELTSASQLIRGPRPVADLRVVVSPEAERGRDRGLMRGVAGAP